MGATGASPKTKLVAFLLGLFLGGVGAHRFYVGRIGSAVGIILLDIAAGIFIGIGGVVTGFNAVLGVVVIGIGYALSSGVGIWVFVDLIMILVTKFRDRNGQILTVWTK
jgi:TM2 domain-containing membrane protein YozV